MQVVTKGYKMSTVTVKDKEFELFIQSQQIASAVSTMAAQMNLEIDSNTLLFRPASLSQLPSLIRINVHTIKQHSINACHLIN